jgi:hypothetical protein
MERKVSALKAPRRAATHQAPRRPPRRARAHQRGTPHRHQRAAPPHQVAADNGTYGADAEKADVEAVEPDAAGVKVTAIGVRILVLMGLPFSVTWTPGGLPS